MQVYGQAFGRIRVGREDDPVYKAANDLRRFATGILAIECRHEIPDFIAVDRSHLRVDIDGLFIGFCEQPFEFRLAVLKLPHTVFDLRGWNAVADRIDELVEFLIGLCMLAAVALKRRVLVHAHPVDVARIFIGKDFRELRVHQVMLQTIQHCAFQNRAMDSAAIGAGAFVARGRAAEMILRDFRITAAAFPALHQAGEEIARTPPVPHTHRLRGLHVQRLLALLHRLPEINIDDPLLRHVLDDPVAFGIKARNTLTGVRVLDIAQPVPDEPPDKASSSNMAVCVCGSNLKAYSA
nr:hypothetical protein [Novosphingobium endophyticum]